MDYVEEQIYPASLANDQIFYRILDGIVDSYVPVLDNYSEQIDVIED